MVWCVKMSNISVCYNKLPDKAFLLSVWIEEDEVNRILPDFNATNENCLCIYGVQEDEIASYMREVKHYADELSVIIKSRNCQCYDIIVKSIFWFDKKETADVFTEFANRLAEQDFYDLIHELQLDYNVAWTTVEMFDNEKVYEIIDHYEMRDWND